MFSCICMQYLSEKAMAPHSGTLAWKIPWMEEPGRLQSMGSQRVGHNRATSLSLFTFTHWRSKWQPTPVILHGESQGWRSLVGCRLWGRTESDTTEATQQQQQQQHLWSNTEYIPPHDCAEGSWMAGGGASRDRFQWKSSSMTLAQRVSWGVVGRTQSVVDDWMNERWQTGDHFQQVWLWKGRAIGQDGGQGAVSDLEKSSFDGETELSLFSNTDMVTKGWKM